ncbi:MAG: four helix bundle protein [Candidatus Magasanikbacteria bacterium]|nr:four helix bundle protein [Candidatus Magasanikbacteria bacterium]
MKTFRFLDFPVYQQTKVFYKGVRIIVKKLSHYDALRDQLLRAALSVILNMAEGSAKKSDKEFARYLEISIASMNEVVACIDVMYDNGLLSVEVKDAFFIEAESIVKQLGGFKKKLYKDKNDSQ